MAEKEEKKELEEKREGEGDGGLVPLALMGTERPITMVKFNADGDLLFTASKGNHVSVWFTNDGRWVGNYVGGHSGVVWSIDPAFYKGSSTLLVSGSGDASLCLWEVRTGKKLARWVFDSDVRNVQFSLGDRFLLVTTERRGEIPSHIYVFEVPTADQLRDEKPEPKVDLIYPAGPKITRATWGFMNEHIITGQEDGALVVWDPICDNASEAEVKRIAAHHKAITSISWARDYSAFLTTSSDGTAILWDSRSYEKLRTYDTGIPMNTGDVFLATEHVVLGGGQEASQVTTSATSVDKFRLRIYHAVYEELLGTLRGHFGPVNTLALSPDGTRLASGSEDGMVRLVHLNNAYFHLTHEKKRKAPPPATAAAAATAAPAPAQQPAPEATPAPTKPAAGTATTAPAAAATEAGASTAKDPAKAAARKEKKKKAKEERAKAAAAGAGAEGGKDALDKVVLPPKSE